MKNGFTITQRNAVVEQHLWCIDTVMAQYAAFMQTEPVDPDDVYQSLAVRLIRAVNSYDPRKGYLKEYILSQLKREMVRIRSTQTCLWTDAGAGQYRQHHCSTHDCGTAGIVLGNLYCCIKGVM